MPVNVALVGPGKLGLPFLAIANALDRFNLAGMCNTSGIGGNAFDRCAKIARDHNLDKPIEPSGLQTVVPAR